MRGYNLKMKDCSFDSILSDLLKGINVEEYNWIVIYAKDQKQCFLIMVEDIRGKNLKSY